MPCLTDEIDCLLCGTRTSCSQVESEATEGDVKWSKYFCELLRLTKEPLPEIFQDGFYCLDCVRKIRSVDKISRLVDNMKATLTEIKSKVEDCLILSNPHLCGSTEEPDVKNQNKPREEIINALEAVKKKDAEPKTAEASTDTDPVTIVDKPPESYFALLDDSVNNDKECQCDLLTDIDNSRSAIPVLDTGDAPNGDESGRKRQLIKIRISSDSVSQEIIDSLTKQKGNSQTRQLIIRGYREVDPPPTPAASGQSRRKPVSPDIVNGGATPTPTPGKKRGRKPKKLADDDVETFASPTTPKGMECKVCLDVFSSRKERKAHLEATHKQGNAFVCSHCPYTITTEQSLIRHMAAHRAEQDEEEDSQEAENEYEENANYEEQDGEEEYYEDQDDEEGEEENYENQDEAEYAQPQQEEDEDEYFEEEESDPEYDCASDDDDYVEMQENPRGRATKRKSAPAPRKSSTKKAKTESGVSRASAPVIKVASDKRISGQVAGTTPTSAADSPRKSGRLRSAYRQYFY